MHKLNLKKQKTKQKKQKHKLNAIQIDTNKKREEIQ